MPVILERKFLLPALCRYLAVGKNTTRDRKKVLQASRLNFIKSDILL